jgi:beta-lactam-binding protein with PASTA domain
LIIAVLGFHALVDLLTDHGNEITVPNLSKLTEEQVEEKLDDRSDVLLDSVNYKSDFPSFLVQQDPLPGEVEWEEKYISKLTVLISSKVPDLIEKRIVKQFPP